MSLLYLHEIDLADNPELSAALMHLNPILPEPDTEDDITSSGDGKPRDLILYRFNQTNVLLVEGVSWSTAMEFANRSDTEAEKDETGIRPWFVGFDYS
jgi:hypothetical protein